MDVLKDMPDNSIDLAIIDPPYGLGKKLSTGGGKMKNSPGRLLYEQSTQWDIIPTDEYFTELKKVSKNQIIWGGNYFNLGPCRGFIIWNKRQSLPTFSKCEYAWTNFNRPSNLFEKCNTGGNNKIKKIHPTQKPIQLYEWLLANYAKSGYKILDTHLGSGSSMIAAAKLGFDFLGIEKDKNYFNSSIQYFNQIINNHL